MNKPPCTSSPPKSGFTLLEVLVVLAISGLLLTMFALISAQFTASTQRRFAQNSLDSQAQNLFFWLENQLRLRKPQTPLFTAEPTKTCSLGWVQTRAVSLSSATGALEVCLLSLERAEGSSASLPKLVLSTLPPAPTLEWFKNHQSPAPLEQFLFTKESAQILLDAVANFEVEFLRLNPGSDTPASWKPTDANPPTAIRVSLSLIDPREGARLAGATTTHPLQAAMLRPDSPIRHYVRTFPLLP